MLCIRTVDRYLSCESKSKGIAKTIADASGDIILNRDLSGLPSLIDQFVEIQGISYIYITDETGEFLAHTFVPGVPEEIRTGYTGSTETVERRLPGIGDFAEVSSPILAGISGNMHVGMDMDLLSLRIQGVIGQQVCLITSIFGGGVFFAIWLRGLVAKPITQLLSAVRLAGGRADGDDRSEKLLGRDDEVGHLARLFLYFSHAKDPSGVERATGARPDPDMSGALSRGARLERFDGSMWSSSYARFCVQPACVLTWLRSWVTCRAKLGRLIERAGPLGLATRRSVTPARALGRDQSVASSSPSLRASTFARLGKSTIISVNSPTAVSTRISPPCSRTISFDRAKPSPVP